MMTVRVQRVDEGYRLGGDWEGLDSANAFLTHLAGRDLARRRFGRMPSTWRIWRGSSLSAM
ncbi:phage integrase family domain protein [Mycobacterium kansasii]|uniref:Phage integrase family domain protein n=1 Tax=Mycobacterium kansasii TaxID=1768 RepID=A0A1V3X5W0_MYCKA|nr:phage integrase family domain protein [Mycobacterium kansasii]